MKNISTYDPPAMPVLEIGLAVEYDDYQNLVRALEGGADEASLVVRVQTANDDDDDLSFLE